MGCYPCVSDSDSDQPVADGPVGPYVARGPVGSYVMLSPCNSDSDPDQPVADGPVGPYVTRGPVGSYGLSSPCASDTPGPVMPMRTFPQSHQGGGECMDMYGGWSVSNVAGTPTALAVEDLWAGYTVTDVSSNGVDDCEDWDSGYQREIIDVVTVYFGGDLCDLEESDWEDPEDVARREYVDDYNFDLLEGMEPMVFVPGGNPSRSDRWDEYKIYLYDGNDGRVPDDDSIVDRECRTWREYCASVGVWVLPLTVCNSQFRSDALDVTLLSEGMAWLCFLSSTDVKTGEVGAMSMDLGGQSMDHRRGVMWNPGIVGQQRAYVCYDCLCLMVLFRAMRLLIQDWAGWPVWTGMIPGYCRTITGK